MAAIPPPINTLPALIDRHHEKVSERPRFHMGASALGHHCDRWLWLSFRWVVVQTFPGRMLRLFRRGHMEEDVLMKDMRAVGIEFSDAQASVDFGGFVKGSADAVIERGVPEAPRKRHVAEFKTHNRQSFKALVKDGVRKSKPIHWAQMQVYMLGLEIDRALYVAVCKDDDSLYSERVRLDVDKARGLVERGHRISQSDRLPPPISTDATHWQCKMCPAHGFCHGGATVNRSCRSCHYARAKDDGTFYCERHGATIPRSFEPKGCEKWEVIEDLQEEHR